ncbi:creatininase family protein [Candidatus Poribacteria bacterium]|jgi:creatinine amidohydrolase|nr:creatininase family protein [Candidatus Poribacteria bacterium]MBT5533440.1 creatininase family protein [Candidatus Poribacteria bacterium]MBT5713067.1 creatininase family protein [Candidatus Poribacteria bacterium]MBT7804135.1 creatininase family protein [Candidatus Poribacteria bacterium]
MDTQEVRLERMTRVEAWERIESGAARVAIVPTGSIEQHLEHLTMGHDIRSATAVAEAVARRVYPAAIVAEPLRAGISEHHMAYRFGSVTLKPGTFHSVVWDACDSFVRHGIEHILILNGHGGNVAPMRGVVNQFRRYFGASIHFHSYWDFLPGDVAADGLVTGSVPGHAQEFETAMALHMFPDTVRIDAQALSTDEGVRVATAKSGEKLLEAIVAALTTQVEAMASGDAPSEIDGL